MTSQSAFANISSFKQCLTINKHCLTTMMVSPLNHMSVESVDKFIDLF
tara:strand:+ start:806 stop:949 length:144 start_codon:yes stop_codon:yes gene_type:complete